MTKLFEDFRGPDDKKRGLDDLLVRCEAGRDKKHPTASEKLKYYLSTWCSDHPYHPRDKKMNSPAPAPSGTYRSWKDERFGTRTL